MVTTWRRRRAGPADNDASGGAWLACGSVLALLPLAATEPMRRILGVAALGMSGARGLLIEDGVRRLRRPPRATAFVDGAALMLIAYLHLITALTETRRLSLEAVDAETASLTRLSTLRRAPHSSATTLVLRANWPPSVLSTPFVLRADAPKHWRVLSQTLEQVAAIRRSENSLDVAADNGPLCAI